MKTELPRNWRNCNPLNVRRTNTQWQGLKEVQNDKSFHVFKSMKWGWRAAFKTLNTYYTARGLHTVGQIIARWAPPEENNTLNYREWVTAAIGIPADQPLPPPDSSEGRPVWIRLAVAMAFYEGMLQPHQLLRVDLWEVVEGWQLAFGDASG